MGQKGGMPNKSMKSEEEEEMKDLKALLSEKTCRELHKSKTGDLLYGIFLGIRFKTKSGSQLKEYCSSLTKEDCRRDCSFLDTCRHMKLDSTPDVSNMMAPPKPVKQRAEYCSEVELGQPQWINRDIHNFRMDILGQFGVIMADPPWDIHMELPYGNYS
ncbi:putative mRNA (2'-O-methyladenosine-N(6)-)-methyltransferase [Rosa chinensis]|uniref:Putative mRNA (2'-O-methyladenosine-N(6)-)-methyltransferase n=1 Tax=Rosa chinensis TaxID=74649 RepID=A0A2P6P3X2_ROSCH|nr:putative mRNA (2'-O-methyladenosine-N(6)-)-methyltransferase [Rosa chinensis]